VVTAVEPAKSLVRIKFENRVVPTSLAGQVTQFSNEFHTTAHPIDSATADSLR